MFMFRLIVYLYDLRHGAAPFGPGGRSAYFFMLPNVCFPLFPVVDYKTLQRSAYNDDALRLYQTGAKWMLRGLVQLALYKIVYFLLVIDPSEAVNGTGAARYMVATYLLYLKISGLFHLIVGLLHMYGFGLAETHHMYLFSSSFTDFWRRINIYWKDFIQKLVFNPVYFAGAPARRHRGAGRRDAGRLRRDLALPLLPVVLDPRRVPDRLVRPGLLAGAGAGGAGERAAGDAPGPAPVADEAGPDAARGRGARPEDRRHLRQHLRALDDLEHARSSRNSGSSGARS